MAGEKDVLGQADALLRRHAIAPPADGSETGGVPVLTDFVDGPPATQGEAAAGEGERELVAQLTAQVEERFVDELERRITERLLAQVPGAVTTALGDLRQELANAIGAAVAEAIERRQVK